ncbi:PilZ domain-containing protein [Nitrospira sp. CMX1]|mgnify:CR=1 FL=1
MEQRRDRRFPVGFRSSFISTNSLSGDGTLNELSIRGCRIRSLVEVNPGTVFQLRVHVSDHESPIVISHAIVRWYRDGSFGCEFVNLGAEEWARLRAMTTELEKEPYQKAKDDGEAA